MAKPITPQKWRERIRRALELQKVRKDEAKRFKRGYTGDYSIEPRKKLDENKDEVAVNFIYTYVETIRPTIVPGTPKAFVEGLDQQSQEAEVYYQAIINSYVRKLGLKEEFRQCVDDWFYSWCAILTEWSYGDEPQFEDDGETPVLEMDSNGNSVMDEDGEAQQAFTITHDEPIVRRLDPWDVIWDSDSKRRKEDRWRAYRMILTVQEFREIPGVTKEMRKQVRGQQLPRDLVRQPMGEEDRNTSTERNFVVLWRIYDLDSEMVYLMPDREGLNFFIEKKDWPYEFSVGGDRFPITILEAKQDAENPYSFSGFKAFWPQIQERNRLRTMLQSNARRLAPGWLGKKGIMDEEQKQKFITSKIGEYNETNGDPKGIITKPLPVLNEGFFAHDKVVGDDLNTVSSLNEFAAGNALADTATEASIMDAKSNVRKGEAKSDFADFFAVVCSKVGQLAQQFLTVPQAVKIRKPENPQELSWMHVTGEHIQGEYHLWVEPGDDTKKNEGLYRQQTLKGADILSKNPWVDQQKLAKKLARVFEWESEDILKTPQQFQAEQAFQQQMQMAEIQAKTKPQKPPIDFAAIKYDELAPDMQAMVLLAALKQNSALPAGITHAMSGGGVPPAGPPGSPPTPGGQASPSIANPPPGNGGMNAGINQTKPVNHSAAMPPPTPVHPNSEAQGGKKV